MIEVLAIGSEVVVDGDIPATINRVCIEDEACCVAYECVWWEERTRKSEWLRSYEVKAKESGKTHKVNFK